MRRTLLALLSLVPLGCAHAPAPAPAREEPESVLRVSLDGSGDFRSVAAALEAAPEGATVRVGPGTFEERLLVTRQVTLEGAGADRTTVVSYLGPTKDVPKERVGEPGPTLRIIGARGVVVKGLTLTGRGDPSAGGHLVTGVVEVRSSAVRFEKAAVVGSPGAGLVLAEGSEAEVDGCLVAGIRGTGIAIAGPGGPVRIADSDIRNCRHRGITVAAGAGPVTIEGCRISGSSWHGIRYDDASPLVRGNLIFGNARSGIYASGRTAGRIEGNLFHRNGMSDVSCWYAARDVIEGNTFAESQRESVAILGGSDPVVRRNVFFRSRTALKAGNIGDGGKGASSAGGGTIEECVFWENGSNLTRPQPDGKGTIEVPLPEGNLVADPQFGDPARSDYSLAPGSTAASRAAGAASPPPFASPWAPRPEEGATAPESGPEPAAAGAAPSLQGAWEMARPWVEDALQIRDAAKRTAAIERIREALASGDPVREFAGLIAFTGSAQVNFDKAPFRDPILPLAKRSGGAVRVKAFYALFNAGMKDGDLDLLLGLPDDPSTEFRSGLSHLIFIFSKGEITGPAGDRVLALLRQDDRALVREALGGIWGARVSPAVEERVLALAKDPATRHDAVYFGLSTFRDKSAAVVEALIDALGDPDFNNSGRALWGLGHGIPKENEGAVAEAMLRLFEARSDPRTRTEALRNVGRYGSSVHLEALGGIASNDLAPEAVRAAARAAVEAIRGRSPGR